MLVLHVGWDSWSHLPGRLPTGGNFHLCEKHVSPPGLEPRSLEYYSNALTKL